MSKQRALKLSVKLLVHVSVRILDRRVTKIFRQQRQQQQQTRLVKGPLIHVNSV